MNIFISGSLAYDRIMDFPGHFADHILPDKIHVLNVCFNINGLVEKFGGTAGNIAYSLSVLGESPFIVATSGEDFSRYEKWLLQNNLPTDYIKAIRAFYRRRIHHDRPRRQPDNRFQSRRNGLRGGPSSGQWFQHGVHRAGQQGGHDEFRSKSKACHAPFFFDPGQSLNIWKGDELREAVSGALCFISNDYELALFLRMTGWEMADLHKAVKMVITTRGSGRGALSILQATGC